MSDARGNRWPHFELVTFSEPSGVPYEVAAPLLEQGVPKDLVGRYHVADALSMLQEPGEAPLVCFGTSMLFENICLDPRTGNVVELTIIPSRFSKTINLPAGPTGPVRLVNSSLKQFTASVRAMVNRFTFDDVNVEESEDEIDMKALHDEGIRVGNELTEILRSIDPAAVADENSFWTTFIDDVKIGDFSTELVVRGE